jgi:hypothetical protein
VTLPLAPPAVPAVSETTRSGAHAGAAHARPHRAAVVAAAAAVLRLRLQVDAAIHAADPWKLADQHALAIGAGPIHQAVARGATATTFRAAVSGAGAALAATHHAASARLAAHAAGSAVKRMAQRIDAAALAEKPRAATDIGADSVAPRADFFGVDGRTARAAMQRVAVDVDAEPIAGLEGRALDRIRQGRGIAAADGDGRKVILQTLRAAQQECPDPGGARAPQHPDPLAR